MTLGKSGARIEALHGLVTQSKGVLALQQTPSDAPMPRRSLLRRWNCLGLRTNTASPSPLPSHFTHSSSRSSLVFSGGFLSGGVAREGVRHIACFWRDALPPLLSAASVHPIRCQLIGSSSGGAGEAGGAGRKGRKGREAKQS
ncbi:hypothetical protein E2C01_085092 [Portunus trituberculatus]|uniref:Uncharacterized protein n=1 Tax=Portunus trituberculatus TaxID=210409 RepID=A0A5B7J1P3_PORTR|nr:hypothetical protein [Portunus trituberculatus]